MTKRAHIVISDELLEQVDEIVGKRKRSQFVEDAIRVKLQRARMGIALEQCAGVLDLKDYPEWSTPEKVSQWVREQRQLDNDRFERKMKGSQG